jgi:hypothetical protein
MGKDQDIRLNIEARGGDQAADSVKKVDEAQKGLTDKTKAAVKPTQELDEATRKAAATEETYTSILGRVHPALGALADGMVKGTRIAGDLATKQIHLGQAFRSATGAIRANWNAIKLFLAGGAVIAAIAAIGAAVRKMKEEYEAATAAIKAHRDALNELKNEQQELQAQIEAVSDASRRGPFDAETARQVAQRAERVRAKIPSIDTGALAQVSGLLGPELSDQELLQAAVLQQQGRLALEPGMTPETMMRRYRMGMEHYGGQVEAVVVRELVQRAQRWAEARREGLASGGSTVNIEDVARQVLPAGTDVKRMAGLAQVYGTEEALRQYEEEMIDPVTGRRTMRTKFDLPEWIPLIGGAGTVAERGSDVERAQLAVLLHAIEANTVAVQEATRAQRNGTGRQGVTIYHTEHNARNTYPDAYARRRNTRNGETYCEWIGDG